IMTASGSATSQNAFSRRRINAPSRASLRALRPARARARRSFPPLRWSAAASAAPQGPDGFEELTDLRGAFGAAERSEGAHRRRTQERAHFFLQVVPPLPQQRPREVARIAVAQQ